MEDGGSLLGDYRRIRFILGQNTAGEFEVVKGLLAVHARTLGPDKRGLGRDVSGELSLRVELGATLCGRDALDAAGVGQFLPIRREPSFTVRRRVDTRRRYANERYQEQ